MAVFLLHSIVIKADGEKLRRILDTIKGEKEDEVIDFNKIIPEPENLYKEPLSINDEYELAIKGIPNWYDWHLEHWGCKWNACMQSVKNNCICFATPWSPVFRIVGALSRMFPDVVLEYSMCEESEDDEDSGTFVILGGKLIDYIEPKSSSEDDEDSSNR